MIKPIEVMKLEDGNFAVRFSNKPKRWSIITKENEIMFAFIVFHMISA